MKKKKMKMIKVFYFSRNFDEEDEDDGGRR